MGIGVPQLSTFSDATLKNAAGSTLTASQIWAGQPTVLYLVRRPGCVLCREEAEDLWKNKGKLDALGVKLVAITKEWDEAEIKDFTSKFWPGDIFFDEKKELFASLSNGEIRKLAMTDLLNPFSAAWKNVRRAKKVVTDHNLKGEGLIPGGLMVLRSGTGGVVYAHQEATFGDHAPMNEVLAAAKKAAS
jgi:peroxiredoxin